MSKISYISERTIPKLTSESCPSCGSHALVACNCGVPYEVKLADRERKRQSQIARREKSSENSNHEAGFATVDIVKENQSPIDFAEESGYGARDYKKSANESFLDCANVAYDMAKFEGMVDESILAAARRTADKWAALVRRLEK